MERENVIEVIDRLYAARAEGDLASVNAFLAPGATYRMVGVPDAPNDAAKAVGLLIDQFHFAEMRRVRMMIDGENVAVQVHVKASTGGGRHVDSDLLQWFQFDDNGKITDITEFADTGLIATMLGLAPEY